jgi:hypothetical protein
LKATIQYKTKPIVANPSGFEKTKINKKDYEKTEFGRA